MDELTMARALHVLAVVGWIGGVYLVTLVVLPAIRGEAGQVERFEEIESHFGLHAKILTLLAGASGFYMLYLLDAWGRYASLEFWWVHAMTLIWALFSLVLFVLEPWFLHAWFKQCTERDPDETFAWVTRFHQILLAASLITIAGAVIGVHG